MNIKDLKEVIKDLPDDMLVVQNVGDDMFVLSCNGKSGVLDIKVRGTDRTDRCFGLVPCDGSCKLAKEPDDEFTPVTPPGSEWMN